MDLDEFLLARIAEDEEMAIAVRDAARARYPGEADAEGLDFDNSGWVYYSPIRLLAECEAKRRIVDEHSYLLNTLNAGPTCITCWHAGGTEGPGVWPCPTLRLLALPYASHPDYRQEWAVEVTSRR